MSTTTGDKATKIFAQLQCAVKVLDGGRVPAVSKHPQRDVAVCIYDAEQPYQHLYYSVGRVDKAGGKTKWGHVHEFDKGKYPSVAVISINGGLYAIECHSGHFFNNIYAHVGKIDAEEKCIHWGESQYLCPGKRGRICADDNGTVIIVHEENNFIMSGSRIFHDVYAVDTSSKKLCRKGLGICQEVTQLAGCDQDIALNKNGKVVIVYRSGDALMYLIGTIKDYRVTWCDVANKSLPATGKEPSVSINSQGLVIVAYQSKLGRQLGYVYGYVEGDLIKWNEKTDSSSFGEYPSISLADDGCIVQIHKTNFGLSLYHTQGELKK